jgi:hypothetical protein
MHVTKIKRYVNDITHPSVPRRRHGREMLAAVIQMQHMFSAKVFNVGNFRGAGFSAAW